MSHDEKSTSDATIPATRDDAAQNILNAAQERTATFDKMLKFKKGKYFIDDDPVPLGSEYLAYAGAWTKAWVRFADGKLAEPHRLYNVARGEKAPDRNDLGYLDESSWPLGYDGRPSDPWVFQYLLPLENLMTGERAVFTTSSVGGRQAVSDLCREYAKRTLDGQTGQPIIRLAVSEMPTKNYGNVLRPLFEVVRWDDAQTDNIPPLAATMPVQAVKKTKHDDMEDEIPF